MDPRTCCCGGAGDGTPPAVSAPKGGKKQAFARVSEGVAWLGSGGLLVLVPKCPMCLAAYVAAGTGLGLSYTTAEYLRTGLIWVCVATLLFMAARRVRRLPWWALVRPWT
jgi:hypothetical protein